MFLMEYLGSTKLLDFLSSPGGHKVTLPIEFQRVKNGTQLDVLVSFEKNLWGVWGRNFPEVILDLSLQSRMYLVLQSHVC